ncbi:fungal specific transcription factor domain-containing protein [Aspergillus melleus]|uniref:fungal specific transcription factor domain-containing protein n=1 Tax=Aspergillus melleus TaxID=138277 RepID=UPI001E8E8809|nr:uncharacterized protein LDX57_008171 [Aspergillus melleus]KAH8430509.1 hypothetical protein LDX57_008171 [Aspergillus melleus]
MDQLVHLPWLLNQYQLWRTVKAPSSIFEIEFTVLLLRICSYTSEFLPSPSCTIDRIRGISLADIRHSCDEAADSLLKLGLRFDSQGGLLRVQHLAFAGLKARCEGRMNEFRHALRSTIQVAQQIGADKDASRGLDELEKETRRRIFCNLYIWDSHLSRQSDRIPILPGGLEPENMPRMRLGPDIDEDAHGFEVFTERISQARLANFWKATGPRLGSKYDILVAEERYEKFCSQFLSTLQSAFALQPDKQWDKQLPMLPQQREILFISIFESLCYNFRPVLFLETSEVQDLPLYKQLLVQSQRKALAAAALFVLQGVERLHALLGGAQTRYTGIIQPTFEAAVLLVSLCVDPSFLGLSIGEERMENVEVEDNRPTTMTTTTRIDPLRTDMINLRREECIRAIWNALSRLQMLAEVSKMADVGAQTLADLVRKLDK